MCINLNKLPIRESIRDGSALGGGPVFFVAIALSYFVDFVLFERLLAAFVVAHALTASIKLAFFRQRPDGKGYTNFIEKIDAASFPSMHSMRAASLWLLVGMYFNNPIVYALCAAIIIGVAWSRIYLKKHFVKDVVAGAIIGFLISLAAVYLIV